jgi:amino acid transporter
MLLLATGMRENSQSVIFFALIISCIYSLSCLSLADAKVATDSQISARTNFTDQLVQQKNSVSNQSSDIKDIKKLTSEEVQLLKSMSQGLVKTTTQGSFTALGVFLIGLSLVIYGLRLTLKATDSRTSRYFKVMIWALITPVIVLIAVYQVGLLLGNPVLIYKSDEPFAFLSLILLIPAAIIVFLLIAERRLVAASHHRDQRQS